MVGITHVKSKTVGPLGIPDKYFFDFLRGEFDGDGCAYSYMDLRWRSSFMFYLSFASTSERFLVWMREEIRRRIGIVGHITKQQSSGSFQLKYAKAEAKVLIKAMYYRKDVLCLLRKKLKIAQILGKVGESLA